MSLNAMVETIALYWFTCTICSPSALYCEWLRDPPHERFVAAPTACGIFPKENVKNPTRLGAASLQYRAMDADPRGGKYPSLEVPDAIRRESGVVTFEPVADNRL